MILATHPSYPNARAYVLKLHRDARPEIGKTIGIKMNNSLTRRASAVCHRGA